MMKHLPFSTMKQRKLFILMGSALGVLLLALLVSIGFPIKDAHAQIAACGNTNADYSGVAFKDESNGGTVTLNSDGTTDVGGTYTITPTTTSAPGAHAVVTINMPLGPGGQSGQSSPPVYYGTPNCFATTRVDEITGIIVTSPPGGTEIKSFLWDRPLL